MQIYSVLELTRYIKQIFDKDRVLTTALVRGEISNYKRHSSGHCYFTLKDKDATLRCVMFRSRAQLLRFVPREGMKVVVGGAISVYERDGQYQMYADRIIPEGVGELSMAFAQLKEKLAAEGLFDETKKKKLPLLPRCVAVITSPTGAAVRDIFTVAKRRYPGVTLLLCPVAVQGTEAPTQIANAIEAVNAYSDADVIIAGRGGGSAEELWAFNDEAVARAIAASKIPIVSAVGHETDYTISDFVADKRAATPSQAAEIVVPDTFELRRYIESLRNMAITCMVARTKECKTRIDKCRGSNALQRPLDMLATRQQAIDALAERLQQAMNRYCEERHNRLHIASEKLAMLGPLAVLQRGYALVRKKDGRLVTDPQAVSAGEKIEIVVSRGTLCAVALDCKEGL